MKVKEKMIGGVAMTQNLTYTRCGDYLIIIPLAEKSLCCKGNKVGGGAVRAHIFQQSAYNAAYL